MSNRNAGSYQRHTQSNPESSGVIGIPEATACAIRRAKAHGGRVVAVGASVVRALENAATGDGHVQAGEGLARQRLGPTSRLRVVDAILSGTHEPGTSHYELLRAFLDDATLLRTSAELDADGYRTHEFGDSVFIEHVRLHHGLKSEAHE